MTIDPKRVSGMTRKPLLFKDIQYAQSQTKSHAEAARYLNVSFTTYKRWATAYELYENEHKNAAGKGVAKSRTKGLFGLDEILAGHHPNYDRNRLKERLLRAGHLTQSCNLCGHTQTRPDGRGPFVLHYHNGNTNDLQLTNLYILCYNCTYLTTGRVSVSGDTEMVWNPGAFSQDQIDVIGEDEMEALRQELLDSQV
jgi:hypothetical protein